MNKTALPDNYLRHILFLISTVIVITSWGIGYEIGKYKSTTNNYYSNKAITDTITDNNTQTHRYKVINLSDTTRVTNSDGTHSTWILVRDTVVRVGDQ